RKLSQRVAGKPDNGVRLIGGTAGKLTIMSEVHLSYFLEHMGRVPTDEDFAVLVDYLILHMPPTRKEPLDLIAQPGNFDIWKAPGKSQYMLTLGKHSTIAAERDTARQLVQECFGVDEEDTTGAWIGSNRSTEVWIAACADGAALETLIQTSDPPLPALRLARMVTHLSLGAAQPD